MAAGKQLSDGNPSGTSLGQASTDPISFYGVTPVVQRSGASQASVSTTAASNSGAYGFTTATQAQAVVTLVNEIRAALVAVGLIAGA